jgi:hypothetical protein
MMDQTSSIALLARLLTELLASLFAVDRGLSIQGHISWPVCLVYTFRLEREKLVCTVLHDMRMTYESYQ